jgi:hypothetical protein
VVQVFVVVTRRFKNLYVNFITFRFSCTEVEDYEYMGDSWQKRSHVEKDCTMIQKDAGTKPAITSK